MKLNVDYKVFHNAIDRFRDGEPLGRIEKEALLTLIQATESDYYPSKHEINDNEHRVEMLSKMSAEQLDTTSAERMFNKCKEFDNKYC